MFEKHKFKRTPKDKAEIMIQTGSKRRKTAETEAERPRRKFNPGFKRISAVQVPMGVSGMPDEFSLKMPYMDSGRLYALATVEPNPVVYRCTGLLLPNYTFGGNKPHYWRELSAIYGKYLVLGMEWEVTLCNASTSAAYAVVAFNTANDPAPTVESFQEMKYSVPFIVGGINADDSVVTRRGYMSYAKIMGQAYIDVDPHKYSVNTTYPVDQYYMFVRVKSCDGSTADVYWKTKLTFYVKWKDLQEPTQSS